MTYPEALDYMASLQLRGWRLGLDRMEEFVRRSGLGHAIGRPDLVSTPEPGQTEHRTSPPVRGASPRFIHVAGTNGKGSVTAYLQYILREAGYRVGGFFSPFVYDIRERVQVDCEMISEEDFARLVERLKPVAESFDGTELGSITEFEFKTAMGFAYWEEKECDWVALEVGLGGRLDATNVVAPACSVITHIGYDHTDILGDTLAKIASEKAGVIKPGVPGVIGDLPEEARKAVRLKAKGASSRLFEYEKDFDLVGAHSFPPFAIRTPSRLIESLAAPIPGFHQPHNLAVALAALDVLDLNIVPETIRAGLSKVNLPGRLEHRRIRGRNVYLDGAHNIDAILDLQISLRLAGMDRFVVVFGMLQGHNADAICSLVEDYADEVHLCPIDFRRTMDPHELAKRFRTPPTIHASSKEAIEVALRRRTKVPILVTGSFYLVGEVGRYLRSLASKPC